MLAVRVIPCLLLRNRGLVKTVRFRDPTYVGDPVNTVRIFNEKEVDELVLLDILASREGRGPDFRLIEEIAGECFMPLGYGGGIRTVDDIRTVLALGAEKAVINSRAVEAPELIREAADVIGSQSVVVSLDVKKGLLGGYRVHTRGGTQATKEDPVRFAVRAQELGAGEILLTSVDRDGTMSGYDVDLVRSVSREVDIPVIACGGASGLGDFARAVREGGASAVAAGSLFVFTGRHRAVLVNYPATGELEALFR